ncbi:NfeD family protein [Mollicutes bacterium LVI A0039]|nr:NfeD family protein [Mollicutes bacterium LVI A0039]
MTLILTIIGIFLIIAEVLTASTFVIWIAIGFLCAALVSLVTSNFVVLAAVGIITTLLSVAVLRTKYVKWVLPKERVETAHNELIGKAAIMKEDYTSNGVDVGIARVGGVDWSVQCETLETSFTAGERVVIKKIEGVRLLIEKEV